MKKAISFIIPCFNNETSLFETVSSIGAFHRDDVEIVIVNDASIDSSIDIMHDLARIYPDVVSIYFNAINMGRGFTRNIGIQMAQADITAILDGDDCATPDRADVTIQAFEAMPEMDLFYGSFVAYHTKNQFEEAHTAQPLNVRFLWETGLFRIGHLTVAHKKSAILELPYSEDRNQDDWYMNWNFFSNEKKFGFTDRHIGVYRVWRDQLEMQYQDGKQERILKKKQNIMRPYFKAKGWIDDEDKFCATDIQ